jgi:predicted MFS family arabinose efflux permease
MPTSQAFVVEMVGPENVSNAIGLTTSLTSLTRIVGPAIGGFIIATSGVAFLFLLNTFSFLAVIIALLFMNTNTLYTQIEQSKEAGKRQNTWQSLHEGLAYVWKTPVVLLAIVIGGIVLLFGSNFDVFLPLFATQVFSVGAKGYGILAGTIATGSLLASLWLAWNNQKPTITRVLICALVFTLVEILFTFSRVYLLSLGLIACVGFMEIAFAALANTTIQTTVPHSLRGRVMSVAILFFTGSVPPGYLLAGWLSSLYGASSAMLLCSLLALMVVGLGWLWWRQVKKEREVRYNNTV